MYRLLYLVLYIYIIGVGYGALQSKDLFLLCIEILYPNGLNSQSKLLNNFFMLKYYGILNFMIFLVF
jgi:hypothetical protein